MPNLSGPTLIVIIFIVLLLFGAPKLPALARSLGQSMKILKKEVTSDEGQDRGTVDSPSPETASSQPSSDDELAQARAEAAVARAEAEALRAAAEKRSAAEPASSDPVNSKPTGSVPTGGNATGAVEGGATEGDNNATGASEQR